MADTVIMVKKKMFGEVIGPRVEPTILLSNHVVKLPSNYYNYVCNYRLDCFQLCSEKHLLAVNNSGMPPTKRQNGYRRGKMDRRIAKCCFTT